MKTKVFLYFLTIFSIIQILFYMSDGLEREQERRGFIKCLSGSRVPGRPTWRQECNDSNFLDQVKKIFKNNSNQVF